MKSNIKEQKTFSGPIPIGLIKSNKAHLAEETHKMCFLSNIKLVFNDRNFTVI